MWPTRWRWEAVPEIPYGGQVRWRSQWDKASMAVLKIWLIMARYIGFGFLSFRSTSDCWHSKFVRCVKLFSSPMIGHCYWIAGLPYVIAAATKRSTLHRIPCPRCAKPVKHLTPLTSSNDLVNPWIPTMWSNPSFTNLCELSVNHSAPFSSSNMQGLKQLECQ